MCLFVSQEVQTYDFELTSAGGGMEGGEERMDEPGGLVDATVKRRVNECEGFQEEGEGRGEEATMLGTKRVRGAGGEGDSSGSALQVVATVSSGQAASAVAGGNNCGASVMMMTLVKGPVMRIEMAYNLATGEHRCLVYRSDRNVAIAKLIWTMEEGGGGEAHVKNVFVHESVRGAGLGRLLFYQLFAALRRVGARTLRLEAEEDVKRHNRLVRFYESMGFRITENARVIYLNHYDDYFRKVPMYREVRPEVICPELEETDSFMVVVLRSPGGSPICGDEVGRVGVSSHPYCYSSSGSTSGGTGSGNNNQHKGEVERIWVLVQDAAGGVAMLEHHVGKFLCAEPDGKVVANRPVLSTWEVFELEPYEDQTDSARELFAFKTFHGQYLRFETAPTTAAITDAPSSSSSSSEAMVMEEGEGGAGFIGPPRPPPPPLQQGGGAGAGAGGSSSLVICTSSEPTLWEVHEAGGGKGGGPKIIEVVPDQQGRRKKPSRYPKQATVRAIHRKMRRINTVDFVQSMRSSYCRFQMDRGMTILQALDLLRGHQDPLLPDLSDIGLSYADTLLAIAQHIRQHQQQQLPEWMHLLGILHGLGRVVFVMLHRKDYDLYEDWCFGGQSWVVGCQIPPTIRYPDVNELNADHDHSTYSLPYGMYSPHCGLDSVLLNWSGAEYMYHFLRHNGAMETMPKEAMAMVRYADLDLWYAGHQYDHLCNEVDREMLPWVRQFAHLRAEALRDLARKGGGGECQWAQGEEGCRQWSYYQGLVDKYLPGELSW